MTMHRVTCQSSCFVDVFDDTAAVDESHTRRLAKGALDGAQSGRVSRPRLSDPINAITPIDVEGQPVFAFVGRSGQKHDHSRPGQKQCERVAAKSGLFTL